MPTVARAPGPSGRIRRLLPADSDGLGPRGEVLLPSGRLGRGLGVPGLATFASWVAVMLPPRLWAPLAKRGRGVLLTGIAVGAAAWLVGQAATGLWQPLGRPTFRIVRALLSLIYPSVICRPDDLIVGTPTFTVEIAPACSGYEGIGLIWAFLGIYFWRFRRDLRFPQAFLLLPIGTALIWVSNAARIAALVAVGTEVSPDVAAKGFHSQAGWLVFVAVGLGLVAASHYWSLFRRNRPPRPSGWGREPYGRVPGPSIRRCRHRDPHRGVLERI